MTPTILTRFDAEMRRDPPSVPGASVERSDGIVRSVGLSNMIISWQVGVEDLDRRIAEQAAYFRARAETVEWKVYGHDAPPNLSAALAAHGFEPGESETFMVFDLTASGAELAAPAEAVIRPVRTPEELEAYLDVTARAFGSRPKATDESLAQRIFGSAIDTVAFLAWADGVAAAGARLELPPHRAFASMWGGGTDPRFRRRGLFRALVAERAGLARSRGYAFLTVDAKETSRPILERLGFVALTSVTAWVLSRDRSAAD